MCVNSSRTVACNASTSRHGLQRFALSPQVQTRVPQRRHLTVRATDSDSVMYHLSPRTNRFPSRKPGDLAILVPVIAQDPPTHRGTKPRITSPSRFKPGDGLDLGPMVQSRGVSPTPAEAACVRPSPHLRRRQRPADYRIIWGSYRICRLVRSACRPRTVGPETTAMVGRLAD